MKKSTRALKAIEMMRMLHMVDMTFQTLTMNMMHSSLMR